MKDYSNNNTEDSFILFGDDPNPVYLENDTDVKENDVGEKSLHKLGEILGLTEEEVLELLKQVRENNRDAINKMIEANLPLVNFCANPYKENEQLWEELFQEGCIALEEAVRKYDYKKGMFSTYAVFKIRFAMIKALQEQPRVIRLPSNVENALNKLKAAEKQLSNELGRKPLLQEIAERMNISTKEVDNLLKWSQDTISLDQPVYDDKNDPASATGSDEITESDRIKDVKTVSPEEAAEQVMLKELLNEMIKKLTINEQRVLILRFGLEDGRPMTLAEIGKALNISGEAVRQTEARALRKLKDNSESPKGKKLRDFLVD